MTRRAYRHHGVTALGAVVAGTSRVGNLPRWVVTRFGSEDQGYVELQVTCLAGHVVAGIRRKPDGVRQMWCDAKHDDHHEEGESE